MVLNPFFLQGSQGEQSLVQDLINEQLRMYGVEVFYLPRQYATKSSIIREVIESEFNNHILLRHMLTILMDMATILFFYQNLEFNKHLKLN